MHFFHCLEVLKALRERFQRPKHVPNSVATESGISKNTDQHYFAPRVLNSAVTTTKRCSRSLRQEPWGPTVIAPLRGRGRENYFTLKRAARPQLLISRALHVGTDTHWKTDTAWFAPSCPVQPMPPASWAPQHRHSHPSSCLFLPQINHAVKMLLNLAAAAGAGAARPFA